MLYRVVFLDGYFKWIGDEFFVGWRVYVIVEVLVCVLDYEVKEVFRMIVVSRRDRDF